MIVSKVQDLEKGVFTTEVRFGKRCRPRDGLEKQVYPPGAS